MEGHDMDELTSVAKLTALAEHTKTVAQELARLNELWEMVERDAPATVPHPAVALAEGYPFKADLSEVVSDAFEWSRRMVALAEAASGDRLTGVAEAIRRHIERLNCERSGLDKNYEGWMRDGLGGVIGDVGAAFNISVQTELANLLNAISDGGDINTIRERADELAAAYLDARTRDFHKH